jgi:hypothetical protein
MQYLVNDVCGVHQCDLSRKQLQFAGARLLGVRNSASVLSPPSPARPRGHEITITET